VISNLFLIMSLWIDKHRPNSLSKLTYHLEQAENLKKLIKSGDFPHLLIYGPPGAGKKTRITCLLKELYGSTVEKVKLEQQTFLTPSKKKIEISTVGSNYHIEVNPSDAGIYDRVVIQDLIKTTAQTHQFDSSSQKSFKVVVLMETDRLTKDAQHALRRTMEKFVSTCRLILCCNSTSKVIPAIRSRCLGIRVAAPKKDDIISGLNVVCKKENLSLPPELASRIADKCNGNMRRALLMCEACRVQQYPFSPDQVIQDADWEVFLKQTGAAIIEQQTPKRLLEVRSRFYELLTHCIPPDVIFKGLLKELIKNCDGTLKSEVTQLAAYYEHRLQLGTKPIYHLEAFTAKFMSIYKRFVEEGMADMF